MPRGKYKRKENNFKIKDDVELNSLWGFDYCFCHSDCGNIHCANEQRTVYSFLRYGTVGRRNK